MYRYIALAGRTAALWVAQVVVKVETDEDNHNSKGRWRRSTWRTYLALNVCLLCTLSYLFFWVYPPPALHDDHFSVFSAMSYSRLFVCVIQNIPFRGLILLCDNILYKHVYCYCLLCTCMCQLQFFGSHTTACISDPVHAVVSVYFDFSAFEWYLFHVPQGGGTKRNVPS